MLQKAKLLQAVLIEIDRIMPDPNQPRKDFDLQKLSELAKSIDRIGLKNPIFVKPNSEEDGYMLVAGERRLQACISLGWEEIPAFIEDEDTDTLIWQIVENTQRVNLNPIEEAKGYARLRDERDMSQTDIAEQVSKSQVHVSGRLKLLKLPERLQKPVATGTFKVSAALILVRGCDTKDEMWEVAEPLMRRHHGIGNLSIATIQKGVRQLRQRKELGEHERAGVNLESLLDRESVYNLVPAAANLAGALSELVGEEGTIALTLEEFQVRWKQIPRLERVKLLSRLSTVTSRIAELNDFLRRFRESKQKTRGSEKGGDQVGQN
ncbi:MAG: ParB/RepB/Spo0J family partition protein [Parcubacteria group bacterium]